MNISFSDRLMNYYEALNTCWLGMTEDERASFQNWKDQHPEMRNSDWPGWLQRIGPRPVRGVLCVLDRRAI